MMTKHPEFWDKDFDTVLGNSICAGGQDECLPKEKFKVFFRDSLHGVNGYIETGHETREQPDSSGKIKETKVGYLDIFVEKGTLRPFDYLNKLYKYRIKMNDEESKLILYSVKLFQSGKETLKSKSHVVEMFRGSKSSQSQRYNDFMLSYFSEHRDKLWVYLNNVHNHPEKFRKFGQEARANLLLYGSPGTGKSSFVYRLAMSLGRHIISLDLTDFSDNKADIYQIIQNAHLHGEDMHPREYIVLLEEFDIAVMHLHNKKHKKPEVDISKYHNFISEKQGTDFAFKTGERDFQLEHLLEIFQGPCPISQSIIIATTNKYKEISELCPALFRPGRLTPIHCGPMTWASLQEMTRYYFKRELSICLLYTSPSPRD